MHLYKTIKTFLFDKEYFVNVFDSHIHLYGFLQVLSLQEEEASLRFPEFLLQIKGQNFRVLKLTKNELLIQGKISEMKFL
ncbi:MAG: YabP/YqfC family sporulation protein [Bacilli bacterium]|nr:YabP/YqfC family sporulation protein [Bacilli bacterium]